MNWDLLRNALEKNITLSTRTRTIADIKNAVKKMTDDIINAAKSGTSASTNGKRQPTYPLDIRNLVQQKRRARRIWHNKRHPTDKIEWNCISKILNNKINEMKNEIFRSYSNSLSATGNTDYSLWKATGHMKRPRVQVSTIRKKDGT
ncbi:Hypothetical protein CINCED_3A021686 [Cinara cedri]|uniref:Endonuclease/exonuclease/phosphatase n=1 Tax=Cinara cedri TaxID=506608 RepID=A0A5E4N3A1_9HEMI|nr:Hypothetical protein CINCED_3A021686 [Cinara cedri]